MVGYLCILLWFPFYFFIKSFIYKYVGKLLPSNVQGQRMGTIFCMFSCCNNSTSEHIPSATNSNCPYCTFNFTCYPAGTGIFQVLFCFTQWLYFTVLYLLCIFHNDDKKISKHQTKEKAFFFVEIFFKGVFCHFPHRETCLPEWVGYFIS